MEISDRTKKRLKFGLQGAGFILISNLILQNNWGIPLFTAAMFIILSITLPPLIIFMSDRNKDEI